MGDKEWSPANILDVFGDRVARAILVLSSQEARSASEIADQLNVSEPTIYRRIDELVGSDLLREHHRIGGDGNQYKIYETILDEVTFSIEDDGYTVDLQVKQDIADDFEAMWSDLERTGTEPARSRRTEQPDGRETDIS